MMNMFMRFDDAYQGVPYVKNLKCFSVIMMGDKRHDVDKGGKIILPASALEQLTRLHIEYPMLFKLVNKSKNRTTHCGVLEFIAEEGRCYLPFWMMRNLLVTEGDLIQVEYVRLPVASFTKFQPQSVDFLEITNPKAVLENALRNFACLTKEDMISINYNDKDYELLVLETKPQNAVSIIECDMDVDFAPPVGYEEPNYKATTSKQANAGGAQRGQQQSTQSGQAKVDGYRLDGKSSSSSASNRKRNELSTSSTDAAAGRAGTSGTGSSGAASSACAAEARGKPFYDYRIGLIRFHHNFDELENEMDIDGEDKSKQPEPPKGHKLKHIGVKQN